MKAKDMFRTTTALTHNNNIIYIYVIPWGTFIAKLFRNRIDL